MSANIFSITQSNVMKLVFQLLLTGIDDNRTGFAEYEAFNFDEAVDLSLTYGFSVKQINFALIDKCDSENAHRIKPVFNFSPNGQKQLLVTVYHQQSA